jgi:gliding motility-associated-like protein
MIYSLLQRLIGIFGVILLISSQTGKAQTQPLPPTMLSVSISPDNDSVTAKWAPSATTDIDGYIIYKYEPGSAAGGYNPWIVSNPAATQFTFKFDTVLSRATPFLVLAYKSTSSNVSIRKNIHTTIFLTQEYDSCQATITLSWTSYEGWDAALAGYRVFQYDNGVRTDLSGLLPSGTNTYTVNGIAAGKDYYFFIQAENNAGLGPVTSNKVHRHTFLEASPKYLYALNANYREPLLADLNFSMDSATDIRIFQLEASTSSSGPFTTIRQFNLQKPTGLSFTDTLSALQPKYYQLVTINSCNQKTSTSNLSTVIIPQCNMIQNKASLQWNAYKDYTDGLSHYNIYRSVGSGANQLIGTTTNTNFSDDVFSLAGHQLTGSICYQIEAESLPGLNSTSHKSISAPVCIDLSENVFIPEAFTPNSDGQNDVFKPFFAFTPSQSHLWIYDRYGTLLFETTDYSAGWDGRFRNGKNASPGAYAYFLKFVSSEGKTIEKKGTFSLIYP